MPPDVDPLACPKCGQLMPENSLTLRCSCGYDLRKGPAGLKGFFLRNWLWGVAIAATAAFISLNPERILYAGLVGAIQGGILAAVLWGISKLVKKKD